MKLSDELKVQPIRQLMDTLAGLANAQVCLFTPADLRAILPEHSEAAFKTLLTRASRERYLTRLCRGVYLYEKANQQAGEVLYHAVTKLRPLALNYLSLESVLSEAGVISQIPINRIMVMSSGRSGVVNCGRFGSIEFIKTRQTPNELIANLAYDPKLRMWRANVAQALRDMRVTRRPKDLTDWTLAHELV